MGYVAQVLSAAGVLFAYELGLRSSLRFAAGVPALALVPYLLVWLERRLVLRGRFRPAAALHVVLAWFSPLAFAVAVCGLGWPAEVERWTGQPHGLSDWPGGALLLTFAPFVVFGCLGIDALARANESRGAEIARARSFQIRMFLATLAPFGLFLGLTWLIGANARWRANVEHVAMWSAALTVGLAATAMLTLPALLRRTWDTVPMPPGRARAAIEEFARHVRFRCNELLVWRTGHQMANAAVVGIGARQRVVIFSDLLLAQLPLRELTAVLAHEIGHVKRHHVLTFVAWSAALFLGLDLALYALEIEGEWALGAGLLITLTLWWLGFGWLSRRSELEADLYAMRSTGDVGAMISALEIVGGPHARSKDSWRHFSTASRIQFLLRAAEDEPFANRLSQRMRWWSRAGLVLAATIGLAQVWRLTRTYSEDRVRVELVLGDYARAVALSADGVRVEPRTRRIAEIGAALGDEERSLEGLDAAARRALSDGDAQRAADLLNLLALRGDARADELLTVLEAAASERDMDDLRAKWPQWAEALEAGLRTGSR